MSEHNNPPWKWHPKSIDQAHNGSIYSEHHTGHAYAIAMQPRYVTDEEWAITAPIITKAVNNHDKLVSTLRFLLEVLEIQCVQRGTDHTKATPESAIGRARLVLSACEREGGEK
jgi:hypothetical protein